MPNPIQQRRKVSFKLLWVVGDVHVDLLHLLPIVVVEMHHNLEGERVGLCDHPQSILFADPASQVNDVFSLFFQQRFTQIEPLCEAAAEHLCKLLHDPDHIDFRQQGINIVLQWEALERLTQQVL